MLIHVADVVVVICCRWSFSLIQLERTQIRSRSLSYVLVTTSEKQKEPVSLSN